MRRKLSHAILASAIGLAVAVSGLSVPAHAAGEDKGLCRPDHSRGTIPGSFPLDSCFDGKTLVFKNNTEFPITLTLIGDDIGQPQRYTVGGEISARLMDFVQPAAFNRQPQTNGPHYRAGVVPPKYYVKASVGNGEIKVVADASGLAAQRTYLIAKTVWGLVPAGARLDAVKTVADLVRELADVGDQHSACLARNNNWGDLGCRALLGRNVNFAFGRAAINLGGGSIAALVALLDTALWSSDAVNGRIAIRDAKKSFSLAAVKAPEPPKREAPQSNGQSAQGGNSNSGSSGSNQNDSRSDSGGSASAPRSTPQPQPEPQPQPQPKPEPATVMATVQNKHVEGSSRLVEDSTPAYLSTSPQPRCKANGCAISGTDMWSGEKLEAICWTTGAVMTNENRNIPDDDGNPHRIETNQWLRGKKNGQVGLISYIYLTPASRDLPIGHC